jgi:glycosyltransferase involved in cell wall biosynthesis
MNLLFLHQNFPAQFKHLAPALAQRGHDVKALTLRPEAPAAWQGVDIVRYTPQRGNAPGIHPWVLDFESKVIRGEAVFRAALEMKRGGLPAGCHRGASRLGGRAFLSRRSGRPPGSASTASSTIARRGRMSGSIPSSPRPIRPRAAGCWSRMRIFLMQFDAADGALSPTRWQANGFPEPFRRRIQVVHDGIDTRMVAPRPTVRITLPDRAGLALSRQDEVITFVNRNLEPGRGYHVLMRALPALLRRRPRAHVLIVGGDGSSYGPAPADGSTWKDRFANEARAQMDATEWARVHFLGNVPHAQFVGMLQLSSVHVYLTYPFVLGWSLIEAMSAGCAIVASDTAPVQEVIQHGETGRLVSFFRPACAH